MCEAAWWLGEETEGTNEEREEMNYKTRSTKGKLFLLPPT